MGEHLPCKQGVMSSNLTISMLAMSHDEPENWMRQVYLAASGFLRIDRAKPVTKKNEVLRVSWRVRKITERMLMK